MFDNKFTKRDALAESVKQVMLENEIRRQVEFTLNEQLGIHSKNALPHEHHAEYDAMLNEAIKDALSEGMWPKKNMAEEDARAKSFAALAPPRDKATQKDRLVGAGVLKPHPTNPNKHVLAKEESLDEVRRFDRIERLKKREKLARDKFADAAEGAMGTPMGKWKTKPGAKKPGAINAVKRAIGLPGGKEPDQREFELDSIGKRYVKTVGQLNKRQQSLEKVQARMQKEAVNPYAVGMSAAMKSTGDKPPLEKSTIMKAHKIAKKVQANESLESILEEIALNLQEQFVYIYENGDYDMMNDFLGSLTEEQAALLGLYEEGENSVVRIRDTPSPEDEQNRAVFKFDREHGAKQTENPSNPKNLGVALSREGGLRSAMSPQPTPKPPIAGQDKNPDNTMAANERGGDSANYRAQFTKEPTTAKNQMSVPQKPVPNMTKAPAPGSGPQSQAGAGPSVPKATPQVAPKAAAPAAPKQARPTPNRGGSSSGSLNTDAGRRSFFNNVGNRAVNK